MAEVLSLAPQPSSPISIMHSRAASASSADAFVNASQQYASQNSRRPGSARGGYAAPATGYRGTAAPIPTFAFSSTPGLRTDVRPGSSQSQKALATATVTPVRHAHNPSVSASSTASTESSQQSGKDDSVIGSSNGSLINLSSAMPDLTLTSPLDAGPKPSPERYRRPGQKRTDSNSSSTSTAVPANVSATSTPISSVPPQLPRLESIDDMSLNPAKPNRYRRRSMNTIDTQALVIPQPQRPSTGDSSTASATPTTIRHVASSISRTDASSTAETARLATSLQAEPKVVSIPPRVSSDVTKRVLTPSPLSQQAQAVSDTTSPTTSPKKGMSYASAAQVGMNSSSPASQHLAALADKDLNKGMKSRLRRAFSFGSAQELRRVASPDNEAAQQVREQHQQQIDDELDAEQLEIARRQEEAGFGTSIYTGQGGFTGSTDNLSISSTASSASMMLRKMGRGAKKGARSIKGLFRPKSVIGVPAADGPVAVSAGAVVQPSVAQVSMVTVEAERQKVNVNADPSERPHGTTGFPKLERNSIDASLAGMKPPSRGSADGSDSRRSIVGSDRDRAEVLAAVKKGILKRSGTASPSGSPVIRPADGAGPPTIQVGTDSPAPSMPSTPKDGRSGSFNSAAGNMTSSDYFSSRVQSSVTRSVGHTPNGSVRSISFSPKIQFHDAWSATEYDRRGEIATCNRLTPMLAQQIKEELNTFKMEMEVHELSKPHTHFF